MLRQEQDGDGEDEWLSSSYVGASLHEVDFHFLEGSADPEWPSTRRSGWPLHGILPSVATHPAGASIGSRLDDLQGLTSSGSTTMNQPRASLPRLVVFLILLGILPASLIFVVDLIVHALTDAREHLSDDSRHGFFPGYLIYALTGVVLCLLSTLYCYLWSTDAEGSGIPQMKSIMSGFYDKCKSALSLWTLAAKALGLVCAIGGGLPVGWEGPNVHISCIIAHHLSRIPWFRPLRRDRALRLQIMVCACSVGLASSFGTPVGGVLYALETTASFYLIPTFWKSTLATIAGAVFYDLFYKTPLVEAFDNTSFAPSDYTRSQLLAFASLGIAMGLMGSFFVKCVHWVYMVRIRNLPGTNRFVLVGMVALMAALLQYPVDLFRLDPRMAINEFFSADNMISLSWVDVFFLVLIKFPLVAISIGLPVPAGVFIPCFLLGAGFGRLFGEVLKSIIGSTIVPGGYAVVGAAAFTAGVTRALSTSVIIFEVTGQLHHMVPTLVAVSLAVVVANSFNRSLYDTLIIMKGLPYMPHMRRDRTPEMRVRDIMEREVVAIRETADLETIENLLEIHSLFESFPVVSSSGGALLGSIRKSSLSTLLMDSRAGDRNGAARAESRKNDDTETIGGNRPDKNRSRKDSLLIEPDISPLIVSDDTRLGQVHFMFVMLMPTHALVVQRGSLVGVITRGDIVASDMMAN